MVRSLTPVPPSCFYSRGSRGCSFDSEEGNDFAGREDQRALPGAPTLENTKFYASVRGFGFRGLGKSLPARAGQGSHGAHLQGARVPQRGQQGQRGRTDVRDG